MKKNQGERGFILIAGTLMILVCVLFLGVGFDAGYLEYQKRRMQTAADAAAVGAALESQKGSNSATAISAGQSDSALNGFTDGTNTTTVTINNPPSSGNYTSANYAYEAIVSQPQQTFFMKLFGVDTVTVKARSVARAAGPGTGCIYALNATAPSALKVSGGTNVTANCSVEVNSNSSTALVVNGSGTCLTGSSYDVGGDYSNGGCALSPAPNTNIGTNQVYDPLSWLSPPTFTAGHCDY